MRTDDGTALIGEIMFQLSGVPEDVARHAVWHAAAEVAESGMCVAEIDVPTQAHVAEYPFDHLLPEGYDAMWLNIVKLRGCCLEPINKCDPCPHGYYVDDMTHVTLYPAPVTSKPDDLQLCVVVKPTVQSCELPYDMVSRCRRDLLHGAKQYLMEMPDKAWSNPQLASYHARQFAGAVASISAAVQRNFSQEMTITTGENWLV